MITTEYIEKFRQSQMFKTLREGFLQDEMSDLLVGNGKFRLTNQFDNSNNNTVPSIVMITAHVLILDNEIQEWQFSEALERLVLTQSNVCLILEYLDAYLEYSKSHSEIKLDVKNKLIEITDFKNKNADFSPHCLNYLLTKIEKTIFG